MPNILLIDDNRNFQFGLASNLRKEGFDVITASNGIEGIDLASHILPEVILCDIKMPDPDGMAVKRALNAEPVTARIPFIFLSALSAPKMKSHGLNLGAEDYITKPVDMDELVARIQSILQRKERADFRAKQEVMLLLEKLQTSLPIHTSHLFRTYVGILLLSLETIKIQLPGADRYLQMAYECSYQLKKLVNDLIWLNEMDLGRSSTLCEQINLEIAFMLPVHELLEIWKSKNLRAEIQIDPGVVVIAPAHSFTQAVCHLVDNACKFAPPESVVKINLEGNGLGGCVLTVQDEGPGIPSQLRELVFTRFYQVQNDHEITQNHGLGLGLYLARSFARTRGGDVQILRSSTGCTVQMQLGTIHQESDRESKEWTIHPY